MTSDLGTPRASTSGGIDLARQLAGLLEGQIHVQADLATAVREQTRALERLPGQVSAAVAEGLHDLAGEVAQRVVASVLMDALQPRPPRGETSGARPAPEPPGPSSAAADRLADAKARLILALAGLLTAAAVGLGGGWLAWGGTAAPRPALTPPPHGGTP